MGRKHKNRKKKRKRILKEAIYGKISMTSGGFGFVTIDETEYFIPAKYVSSAMHGDVVGIVEINDRFKHDDEKKRGPVAKVIEIKSRETHKLVGELIAGHKVRPLSKNFPENIPVTGSLIEAHRGDWVQIDVKHSNHKDRKDVKGNITKVLGRSGVIENDLNAIIQEYELEPPYSDADNEEAAKLKPRNIKREDFTDRFCITVDPIDAKDRDDGVSLKKLAKDNLWELSVHIADVAAWIRPNSKWDKEAFKRSFTSYLPGKTLPMLPKSLTKLISLSDEQDGPAHSVIMTVNGDTGEVVSSRRTHTTIRVAANLNFDQIDNLIQGNPDPDWSEEFTKNVKNWIDLVRKMRQYRKEHEEFLELATVEIRVLCDDENKEIIGLKREIQTEADTMIEDCMLAANSEVAKELIEKSIPGMFRIHPEPDPEKLEEFSAIMLQRFDMVVGDLSTRRACNEFLASLPDDHRKPLITNAFLRTLARASYSEKDSLHFGLGKMKYSHFTSPIRRYPDLIVHQQLLAHDCNERMKAKSTIQKIAQSCSEKEANNDEAYYAANDRLKLHYLQQLSENDDTVMHEAVITKITGAGFSVDIPELGIYGWVDRDILEGLFRKKGEKLISLKEKKEFACGDFIYVKLTGIDLVRSRALFKPVGAKS